MQLYKFKDAIRSWSNWVLASITVTPILNANVEAFTNLLPESWKPYAISALGILGLIVRQIKQK